MIFLTNENNTMQVHIQRRGILHHANYGWVEKPRTKKPKLRPDTKRPGPIKILGNIFIEQNLFLQFGYNFPVTE
jgi:hypothetical protein